MIEDMVVKDEAAISSLIDTRTCTKYSECVRGTSKSCKCEGCALKATSRVQDNGTVYALKLDVIFPITNMDSVTNLVREMLDARTISHYHIIPKAGDILNTLSQFLQCRLAPD